MSSDLDKLNASKNGAIDMPAIDHQGSHARPKLISNLPVCQAESRPHFSSSSAVCSIQSLNDATPSNISTNVDEKQAGDSPNGFLSFFSSRQRKPPSVIPTNNSSVKQSRLMCVAKIDEAMQTVDDLMDFYSRVIKAEHKVSNALWRTVQYSKTKKTSNQGNLLNSNLAQRLSHPAYNENFHLDNQQSESSLVGNSAPIHRTNSFASKAKQVYFFSIIYILTL